MTVAARSIWAEADYRPAKLCKMCGRLIDPTSEVCREHAQAYARIQARVRRVVELAQHRRHVDHVLSLFTFERIVTRAERMVRK